MNDLWTKKQWVCRKADKTPINPYTGNGAKSNDPSTWSDGDTADNADKRYGTAGIGVMFYDGLAGVDIDSHKWDDGNPIADEVLELFKGTYIEKSPSGKGWHILFYVDYGRLNDAGIIDDDLNLVGYKKKNNELDIESYLKGRYFTVTYSVEHPWFTDWVIRDMTDQYIVFLNKYMAVEKPKPEVTTRIVDAIDLSIEELIDKARTGDVNGAKFTALYDNGDLSAYNNDHSAADQALCNYLAFWLGKDATKMDTAFRASALMRPKWDEVHDGTRTYGDMTIDKAIQDQTDVYTGQTRVNTHIYDEKPSESLSEPQTGDIFDLNVFKYELAQHNIKVRLNCITQDVSFVGLPEHIDPTKAVSSIVAELYGPLRKKYKGVSTKLMTFFIDAITADMRNQFNPVLDYFAGKKWDGYDHLGRLYKTLGIEDDELSKTLVRKWFMQGWALLHNDPKDPYGGEGVLTLAGPQGCGKTSFFRVMSIKPSKFFREGQSITGDKDTTRRAVTAWITELGEIGCTFKSDMDALKNFITAPKDTYRLPYAASDTVALRRTSLGGTVNGEKYLIDTTGNRRFWTVPITKNIADELYDPYITDPTQIWLQVWEQYCNGRDVNDFRLTKAEQDALNRRNGMCEKPLKYEDEIRDILAEIQDDSRHYVKRATCKQFKEQHDVLRNATTQQIGAVLDRLGYPQLNDGRLMTVDGIRGRYRELPWV